MALEVRSDTLSSFNRNISFRDNTTSAIFIDHDITGGLGIGSGQINLLYTIPTLTRATGTAGTANLNVNGRNGNGYSITNMWAIADNTSTTLNNNSSGTVAIAGNINPTSSGTARTFTIGGGGDWTVGGLINMTGQAHTFTKANSGALTFTGSGASTFTGNANINDGTVAIRTISSLNSTSASAGRVVLGGGAAQLSGDFRHRRG